MDKTPNNHREALHAYDPDRDAPPTEASAEAAEAALADRELHQWWIDEQDFDRAFRAKMQEIPVPPRLQERILEAAAKELATSAMPIREIKPPARNNHWHWSAFAGAAAAVMILAVLYTFVFNPFASRNTSPELEALVARLESVLVERSAPMHRDNNFVQLTKYLEAGGAPVPKFIPAGLPQNGGFACANLEINGVPVGMMCFRVDNGVYHIFTIDRVNLPNQVDLPREVVSHVGGHCCATWTKDDQLYILATTEPEEKMLTLL